MGRTLETRKKSERNRRRNAKNYIIGLYLDQVNDFYLVNKIYSEEEFEWILLRNIALTKCYLGFDVETTGNITHLH